MTVTYICDAMLGGNARARRRVRALPHPAPEGNRQDPFTEDHDQRGGLIAETRSFAEIIREEPETRQARLRTR